MAYGQLVARPQIARPRSAAFFKATIRAKAISAIKRGIDISAAALILAIFAPVMLVIAMLIKLDSSGGVFYRQTRVGELLPDGSWRLFSMLKFRTMRPNAEQGKGPMTAMDGDPRITRCGHLLRRLRLDELPQLINVLRGEMSLVGPRPERPSLVRGLAQAIPYYEERMRGVKPGLTGLAQISLGYNGRVLEGSQSAALDEAIGTTRSRPRNPIDDVGMKLVYDFAYLAAMERFGAFLRTELGIIFKTPWVMFRGTGR